MESVTCALCSANAPVLLRRVPDIKLGRRDAFCLVRCGGCGLIYLNPRPTLVQMQRYYDGSYRPHTVAHGTVSEGGRADDHQYYIGRVEQFLDCLPHAFPPGRLLDVGCGDGYWPYLMWKRGWETTGVELSPQVAAFARERYGLNVRAGSLFEQRFPAEYFDVVTFWHSLEHLHAPRAALQETCRILREGGAVAVQVPNIDTVLFRIFQQHYSMIQAPYHLYHFSPSSMAALLTASGFEIYQTVYSPGVDGIALSLKNWWLSVRRDSPIQTGRCTSLRVVAGDSDGGAVTWFKRKVALPVLRPMGKLLAVLGHGDVFSMYARKR